MSTPDQEFLEKLEAIRRSYMEGAFPQQLQDVNAAVASFIHPASDGGVSLEAVHAVAHKLAGSAGTFGMMEVSVAARALSELTDTRKISVSDIATDIEERIDAHLETLNDEAARASGAEGDDCDVVFDAGSTTARTDETVEEQTDG